MNVEDLAIEIRNDQPANKAPSKWRFRDRRPWFSSGGNPRARRGASATAKNATTDSGGVPYIDLFTGRVRRDTLDRKIAAAQVAREARVHHKPRRGRSTVGKSARKTRRDRLAKRPTTPEGFTLTAWGSMMFALDREVAPELVRRSTVLNVRLPDRWARGKLWLRDV